MRHLVAPTVMAFGVAVFGGVALQLIGSPPIWFDIFAALLVFSIWRRIIREAELRNSYPANCERRENAASLNQELLWKLREYRAQSSGVTRVRLSVSLLALTTMQSMEFARRLRSPRLVPRPLPVDEDAATWVDASPDTVSREQREAARVQADAG